MPAKLIMFDGPDGVGKTTQIHQIANELTAQKYSALITRINGGSPIGEELRKVYLSNIERPAATDFHLGQAIFEAFVVEIAEQRDKYDVILVDRSPLSNVAYQSFGSGYPVDESVKACKGTLEKLHPDLLICYRAPLEILRGRLSNASDAKTDYFESKPDEYFQKVIEGYDYCIREFGVSAVDASGDTELVHSATMKLVAEALQEV